MNMLKITVLSISLATVTSGAAVAPALGLIAKHFSNELDILIKLIIVLPSLFIIFSSFIFSKLANYLDIKKLACIGYILFLIGGVAPFFCENIYVILFFRAIIGLGVGFLIPLSTSLLGFLFAKSEQAKLMSLGGMCNQLGAVVTVSFSGYLASISWQYSFLIYLFAAVLFILCMIYLPKVKIGKKDTKYDMRNIKNIFPLFVTLFFVQVLFYNFTNNFSIVYEHENLINPSYIGILMGFNGLCGAFVSYNYAKIKNMIKEKVRYAGIIFYILAFSLFSMRFDEVYAVFGINLMLILGVIGAIFNGIATGLTMPFLLSQISIKSKKINLAKNMSIASMAAYSGQFMSPFIDEFILCIFDLHHLRDAFLVATFIAIFLFIYNLRLKIKIK